MSRVDIAPPQGWREAWPAAVLRYALRWVIRPFLSERWPFAVQRLALRLGAGLMPEDRRVSVHHDQHGTLPFERMVPQAFAKAAGRRVILYIHGGAFVAGSPRTHRSITRRLSALTGAQVLVPDYRLAPEHPFPAQIEDCLAMYRHVLAQGVQPEHIVLAGDSAGGHLAYVLALIAPQLGLPSPAALYLISPALRLLLPAQQVGGSYTERADRDPLIAHAWGRAAAAAMQADAKHPWANPLNLDLRSLPPTLVQVGEDEILFDDSTWLVQAAQQAGRDCTLEVWQSRWHVFQVHAGLLPSADQALVRAAAFFRRQWGLSA